MEDLVREEMVVMEKKKIELTAKLVEVSREETAAKAKADELAIEAQASEAMTTATANEESEAREGVGNNKKRKAEDSEEEEERELDRLTDLSDELERQQQARKEQEIAEAREKETKARAVLEEAKAAAENAKKLEVAARQATELEAQEKMGAGAATQNTGTQGDSEDEDEREWEKLMEAQAQLEEEEKRREEQKVADKQSKLEKQKEKELQERVEEREKEEKIAKAKARIARKERLELARKRVAALQDAKDKSNREEQGCEQEDQDMGEASGCTLVEQHMALESKIAEEEQRKIARLQSEEESQTTTLRKKELQEKAQFLASTREAEEARKRGEKAKVKGKPLPREDKSKPAPSTPTFGDRIKQQVDAAQRSTKPTKAQERHLTGKLITVGGRLPTKEHYPDSVEESKVLVKDIIRRRFGIDLPTTVEIKFKEDSKGAPKGRFIHLEMDETAEHQKMVEDILTDQANHDGPDGRFLEVNFSGWMPDMKMTNPTMFAARTFKFRAITGEGKLHKGFHERMKNTNMITAELGLEKESKVQLVALRYNGGKHKDSTTLVDIYLVFWDDIKSADCRRLANKIFYMKVPGIEASIGQRAYNLKTMNLRAMYLCDCQ